MKHGLFRALAVVSASALLVGGAGLASADNLEESLGANGSTTITLSGGSAFTDVTYWVNPNGSSPCSLSSSKTTTITLSVSPAAGVTVDNRSTAAVNDATMTFSACGSATTGQRITVRFTATSAGSRNVTAEDTAGLNVNPSNAIFTLNVQASANTPPNVAVAGVAHGDAYEFGAVPAAVCNVTDAQDGATSFPATLSAITGTLSAYGLGSRTASCSYTDAGGLTRSASATYSIVDTTKPTLNVPGDQTIEATSTSGASATFDVTGSDNVALADGSPSCDRVSGSTFAKGSTTVNCSAVDVAGNQRTGSFTVTVVDTTQPNLVVGNDVTVEATGPTGAVATYTAATASDVGDGVLTPTCLPASSTLFALGNTTVNCSVQDSSGNSASGSLTVHVVDTTAPSLTVPGNLTREATSAAGRAVTYSTTASDLVDGALTATCDKPSGTTFPIGTTTVSCQVADARGNSVSDSFTITVQDTTAPGLSLPADITEEATGSAGAVVTYAASATDAVDGSVAASCIPQSGSTFGLGTTTVNCTAIDAARNKSEGSFTVTVEDTTAPSVTVPDSVTEEATGSNGAVVTFSASSLDIVDGASTPTCSPASGSTFALGTTEVTCSATDNAGNTGSEKFNVLVQDTTPPAVSVPDDKTLEAGDANGASTTFSATATDVVDGSVAATCTPASGSTFPLGSTSVVCSATDAAGNTGTNSFNVKVHDTTAPVVTVPGNQTVEATGPSGAVVNFSSSAYDTVSGELPATCDPASGATFGIGTKAVDCAATDEAGNTGHGGFTVTVRDTTAPTVNVPADKTVEATGPTGAVVNFTVGSTDIVDGAKTASCAPAGGSTFPLGTTEVTCTATDAAGNTGSASFQVTVQDTTAPAVDVPADQTVEATGPGGAVVTFAATANDTVSGSIAPTCVPASGSTFALGTKTVDCTATDAAGNTGQTSFTVTVRDTTAPVVVPPANQVVEATGSNGATVNYTATANDTVSGSIAPTCVPASGSTFALGTKTVDCTATDAAGNTGQTSFTVTVRDTTGPTLNLPANIATGATSATGKVVTFTATSTDVVDGSVTVTCTPPSGALFGPGTTEVKCTATDAAGNTSNGSFFVTVTFGWNGFFAPVDNNGVVNTIKGGQTVPLKWNLPNGSGGWISSLDVVQRIVYAEYSCQSAPTDDIETTATGGTSLRYDTTANQYIYNWQTPKTVGKCYKLTVTLTDTSTHTAYFKTK